MSKGNLFLSQARGKVGSVVFSVLKGQQITRVYNSKPANPRSALQQAQRAKLANSTKFYKEAIENFYRFAFEDKLRHESDFNAFSRINIDRSGFLTKEQVDSLSFPAVGNFALSRGSLAVSPDSFFIAGACGVSLGTRNGATTVGAASSSFLTAYPNLAVGDIATFVLSVGGSSVFEDFGTPNTWVVRQFIINPNDETPLSEAGLTVTTGGSTSYLGFRGMNSDTFGFFGVVFSRNTSHGLEVCNSDIFPSPAYGAFLDWSKGKFAQAQAARSYGASDEAILQGGLVSTLSKISTVTIGGVAYPAYSLANTKSTIDSFSGMTVTGTGLRPTSSGGSWTYNLYTNEDFSEAGAAYRAPESDTLVATISGNTVSFTNTPDLGAHAGRSYLVFFYNGEPFLLFACGK